jgi:hypothetical protein
MAGSYEHILHGWSLIENMGDAYEAVEELMWLVQSQIGETKAKQLLAKKFYPMYNNKHPKDSFMLEIENLMGK